MNLSKLKKIILFLHLFKISLWLLDKTEKNSKMFDISERNNVRIYDYALRLATREKIFAH